MPETRQPDPAAEIKEAAKKLLATNDLVNDDTILFSETLTRNATWMAAFDDDPDTNDNTIRRGAGAALQQVSVNFLMATAMLLTLMSPVNKNKELNALLTNGPATGMASFATALTQFIQEIVIHIKQVQTRTKSVH